MSNKCCSLTDARAIFDLRRSVNCGALETEASSWLIHVIEPYCSSSSWIASLHFLLLIRSLQWCHCGGDITATLNGCVHFVRMMWIWLQCDPLTLHVDYTYYLVFHHQYRMSVTVSAVTLSYFLYNVILIRNPFRNKTIPKSFYYLYCTEFLSAFKNSLRLEVRVMNFGIWIPGFPRLWRTDAYLHFPSILLLQGIIPRSQLRELMLVFPLSPGGNHGRWCGVELLYPGSVLMCQRRRSCSDVEELT